ncbi:hypothetical protein PHSY_006349 [Pseudozyma hubeiensis SY62]|uniref:Uncharacterized protein n=1 Tax=Pseudozyma hubeiensis (strain SY62) TaxID=1305764 RepID=R9PKX9_PSEHS|nr:hypothetical protein PHSY_006349 [Pseudozyma hubeiensis SY62]GAC98755.1 hypothetical protein PHSY_006349 [Pseudozyma hubeiensis SY62]
MDGDRASAARKLPQTAANFFVGPNSRVPRTTLAQSSHVISTPAINSPGPATSPHVARQKLRASPFPISPTFTKDLSSPRSAGNPGSKVAKAVHLFSNLADEAGASTSNSLETPATSSFYIETSPNSSPFVKYLPSSQKTKPSPSTNGSLIAGSEVDVLHRNLTEQQHNGEAFREIIPAPGPVTLHPQSATGTECYLPPFDTLEDTLVIPASAFSDLTASLAIAANEKTEILKQEKDSPRSEKASSHVQDEECLTQADHRPGSPPPREIANILIAQATSHRSSRASMSSGDTRLPATPRSSRDFEVQESKLSWTAHRALLGELELLDSPPHIDTRCHQNGIEGSDNRRHQTLVANEALAGDIPEIWKPSLDDLDETSRSPLQQEEGGDTASHQAKRDSSLLSKERVGQGVNQRTQTHPALLSDRLTWHSQDDLQDSSDSDRSVANGAMLFDLIDMVDTPASPIDNARSRDSRLSRTAIWIKSTMNEFGSIPEQPASPHKGHDAPTPLSLVLTSGTTARPAQIEHQRSLETLQQNVFEEEAASVDHMTDGRFSTREPTHGPDGDPVAAEIRSLDSRRDPGRSLLPHISPAQPNREIIGRSFSQRARAGQQAVEKVRRTPGRLKIPEARISSSTRQRRDSLKLLDSRRNQNVAGDERTTSLRLDTSRSRHVAETGRKNAVTNMLHSWSATKDEPSIQAVSSDHTKHHVGRMVEDWDGVNMASDDEEVASVATYKRLTLRRTSDFAVHTTPRRESRPLPGKLSRFGAEAPTTQTTPRRERPLMRLRSSPSSPVVQKTPLQPGRRTRPAGTKSPPSPPSHGNCPAYRNGTVQQDTSDSSDKRKCDIVRSGLTLPRESALCTDLKGLFSDAQDGKLRSPLRPSDNPLADTATQQENVSVTKRKPPTRTLISGHEEASFRPAKVQTLSSAFSTPRRLAVSTVETSPRTIVSELWTPAQSNPAGSALTDETRVSIPDGSQKAPLAEVRPGQRSWDCLRQYQRAIPRRVLSDSSRHGARFNSQDQHLASHDSTSHLQPRPHSTPHDHRFLANTTLGARHNRRRPSDPPSGLKQSNYQRQRTAAASENISDTSVPGFEISFQLTEPQMAPDVQQGTLLEFGLRVHIKPSRSAPFDEAWTLRPPSQACADSSIGSARREASSSRLPQYEYDNLSASDMSRVQEEAQEHLHRTITVPKQRASRINAGGVATQPSEYTELDPDFSFHSTAVSDTADSPNSRSYLRAMRLTGSQQFTGSRSVGSSSIVDHDRVWVASRRTAARRPIASPGLASPLPYIKRAPPRAASLSAVALHS